MTGRTVFTVLFRGMIYLIFAVVYSILLIGYSSVNKYYHKMEAGIEVTAFLNQDVDMPGVAQVAEKLRAEPYIGEVHYVSPEDALREFVKNEFFKQTLTLLPENPLPSSFVIKLKSPGTDLERLLDLVKAMKEIEVVFYNDEKVGQLEFAGKVKTAVSKLVILISTMITVVFIVVLTYFISAKLSTGLIMSGDAKIELITILVAVAVCFVVLRLTLAVYAYDWLGFLNAWQCGVVLLSALVLGFGVVVADAVSATTVIVGKSGSGDSTDDDAVAGS
ncbi:MAG: permease-like cell division protein FtsX [Elusimicrobiota bacterium]